MNIVMYLQHSLLPRRELTLFRCIKCTRPLFKATADTLVMSNALGSSYQTFEPNSLFYIEHQCHSCKSLYKILFQ